MQPNGKELPPTVSYNGQDYTAYSLKGKDRKDAKNLYLKENRKEFTDSVEAPPIKNTKIQIEKEIMGKYFFCLNVWKLHQTY